MTVDEVRRILAPHRDNLSRLGVVSLHVFGSVARGEAGPDSDVDFLIELDPGRRISLLAVAHIKGELEDLLGRTVDLVEPHVLKERMREQVLREAVRAA